MGPHIGSSLRAMISWPPTSHFLLSSVSLTASPLPWVASILKKKNAKFREVFAAVQDDIAIRGWALAQVGCPWSHVLSSF